MPVEGRKLAIGVSSFHSDEAAVALVKNILSLQIEFEWLFVVDSQADGKLGQHLTELGNARIRYYPEQENIGSAGNLARRLQIAADLGVDWLLAFNHDAPVTASAVAALFSLATTADHCGALYPLRFEQARDQYDLSGKRWFPFGFRGMSKPPPGNLTPVYWGSSNGALYSLEPVRAGLIPQESLWMGWEDYLYGLVLERAGWHQWLVRDAEIRDNYEFRRRKVGGLEVVVSDKPCWYYYYAVRNILLAHLHVQPSVRGIASLAVWLPAYAARILAFPGRCSRRQAIANFAHGVLDGVGGRSGKWRLP